MFCVNSENVRLRMGGQQIACYTIHKTNVQSSTIIEQQIYDQEKYLFNQ